MSNALPAYFRSCAGMVEVTLHATAEHSMETLEGTDQGHIMCLNAN